MAWKNVHNAFSWSTTITVGNRSLNRMQGTGNEAKFKIQSITKFRRSNVCTFYSTRNPVIDPFSQFPPTKLLSKYKHNSRKLHHSCLLDFRTFVTQISESVQTASVSQTSLMSIGSIHTSSEDYPKRYSCTR
jgi:hypothetical protein